MAGPPAAGKTTLVRELGAGFRRIDSDLIKDMLIRQTQVDGPYDALVAVPLLATEPLHPRELSALVHVESTQIAYDVQMVAARRRENVV